MSTASREPPTAHATNHICSQSYTVHKFPTSSQGVSVTIPFHRYGICPPRAGANTTSIDQTIYGTLEFPESCEAVRADLKAKCISEG